MGGHFLGYRSGPFLTYADLAAWHDDQHHKAQIGFHYRGRKEVLRYSTFDSSCPLVLCHFDLHMRNILVDKNYRVWLIDWDHAGAYPPWFEYTNLASWANAPHPLYRLPRSFAWFISFIAGRYIWYYTNYIAPLILHVETFQHINTNHPVIQRPTDVARPPVRQRMAQIAMGVLYDCLSKMWSFFVPEVAGGRT
ncbi:hypothetical protein VNI00_004730 [Paramarasmius palmivorus]|uniref:Aminoglycoside phosphotransferase domain-containing protein n=1 Tax=Paramarasmius palmivorus TaxID=297713 RepID=A0AAW0DIK4_9AGAR